MFNSLGLELHGSEVSSGTVEALGCVIEGGSYGAASQATGFGKYTRLWRACSDVGEAAVYSG